MTDPQVFYNREDLWGFPRESYAGQTVPMQPYYVIMRLPGQSQAEYMLMLPMTPSGRDNMISWMAARCDGADYGHLFEYSFSKDKLFYGPYQIQARINQNPEISRQLSLWNQEGSKVLLGNLLVIPIQDSLLYVEPLFIRAENGQLPELQRVVASYSDRVVMGDTLDLTMAALFQNAAPQAPTIAKAIANESAPQSIAQGANVAAGKGRHAERGATLQSRDGRDPRRRLDGLRRRDEGARRRTVEALGFRALATLRARVLDAWQPERVSFAQLGSSRNWNRCRISPRSLRTTALLCHLQHGGIR